MPIFIKQILKLIKPEEQDTFVIEYINNTLAATNNGRMYFQK